VITDRPPPPGSDRVPPHTCTSACAYGLSATTAVRRSNTTPGGRTTLSQRRPATQTYMCSAGRVAVDQAGTLCGQPTTEL